MRCALLLATLASAWAQKPGTVEGIVTNSITASPVRAAQIALTSTAQSPTYLATTDDAGHFRISNVAPGAYVVQRVTAQSYSYAGPTSILTVRDEQQLSGIRIAVDPLGIISGRVVDEDGAPLRDVAVDALAYTYSAGARQLSSSSNATTDDRGEYRIFDLKPGRYFVRAWLRPSKQSQHNSVPEESTLPNLHRDVPETGYLPVFYPGALDASQALASLVSPGAEWSGVNFKLRAVPTYHVRGAVTGNVTPPATIMVDTCTKNDREGILSYSTNLPASGKFDIPGVLPGSYCVRLLQYGTNLAVYARENVTVTDRSVDGVTLHAIDLPPITGTVEVEGQSDSRPQIQISLSQSSSGVRNEMGGVIKDLKFTFARRFPELTRVLVAGLPAGMYLKSLYYGTGEVTSGMVSLRSDGSAFKIVLATGAGQLSGTVVNAAGDVVIGARVTIAPAGRNAARSDLLRDVSCDFTGHFQAGNLPPGDYKIYAWADRDVPMTALPEFRQEFSGRAVALTIDGGSQSVQLHAIPLDDTRKAKDKYW